jgi:F420H(2)-dependent quinone reductase
MNVGLNEQVEALVRRGFGSPCALGPGLVVVETTGRVSGKSRTVPLLAQRFGNTVLVSTVRKQSQWVRNIEVDPNPSIVLNGRSQSVDVSVTRFGDWTLVRMTITSETSKSDAQAA